MGNSSDSKLRGKLPVGRYAFKKTVTTLADKKEWNTLLVMLRDPRYSDCVFVQDAQGLLPLHMALVLESPFELVEELLRLNPSGASTKDGEGKLPLHYASSHQIDVRIIYKLLEMHPIGSRQPDNSGMLPIHYAASNKHGYACIAELLKSYPSCARIRTKKGLFPLHLATQSKQSIDVINILLCSDPTCLYESIDGKLPIHYACESRCGVDVIEALLAIHPAAASSKSIDGKFPLHYCAANKALDETISYMIDLCPAALLERDHSFRLPLHHALERLVSIDSIFRLLLAAPESTRVRGHGGNLALHVALEKNMPAHLCIAILAQNQGAAKEPDMFGFLPLRRALNNHAEDKLLIELLDAHPQAAAIPDDFNRFALHYAATRKMGIAMVQHLLKAHPAGASAQDSNLQLPLHLGINRQCDLEVIEELLRYFPGGTSVRDRYEFLPLHYAIEVGCNQEIINLLLSYCIDSAAEWILGKMPLHLAIEFKRFDLIPALLTAFPEGIRLAERNGGRIPIAWAIERGAPVDVLLLLDDAFPSSCTAFIVDHDGMLPVHYAIKHHAPLEIVRRLLDANPEAIFEKRDPKCPFFFAPPLLASPSPITGAAGASSSSPIRLGAGTHAARDSSSMSFVTKCDTNPGKALSCSDDAINDQPRVPVLNSVLQTKDVVSEADNKVVATAMIESSSANSTTAPRVSVAAHPVVESRTRQFKTLIHFAAEDSLAPAETVAEILQRTMPLSTTKDFNPRHHFAWTFVMGETEDRYWESAEMVLSRYERDDTDELVEALSNCTDERGKRACDVATPRCKRALLRRINFFVRYELKKQAPLHASNRSIVLLAHDHDDENRLVALKLMRSRLHFDREVALRSNAALTAEHVLPGLRHHDGSADSFFLAEVKRKGFDGFPYCLAMDAAERDLLGVILHEHIFGRDWDKISEIADQVLRSLNHIHTIGLIHGDVKPLNIVRHKGKMKLIDFGATVSYKKKDSAGEKISSAYLPPEMFSLYSSAAGFALGADPGVADDEVVAKKPEAALDSRYFEVKKVGGGLTTSLEEEKVSSMMGLVLDEAKIEPLVIAPADDAAINVVKPLLLAATASGRPQSAHRIQRLDAQSALCIKTGLSIADSSKAAGEAASEWYGHNPRGKISGDGCGMGRLDSPIRSPGDVDRLTASFSTAAESRRQLSIAGSLLGMADTKRPLSAANGSDEDEYCPKGLSSSPSDGGREAEKIDANIGPDAKTVSVVAFGNGAGHIAGVNCSNSHNLDDGSLGVAGWTMAQEILGVTRDALPELTVAHPTIDMWSLGATLYYLCSGEPLWLTNIEDCLDDTQLCMLADWPDDIKAQRLLRVRHPAARNLLSQLLSKIPSRRPSATVALRHPFVAGGVGAVRYPGMPPTYDVCVVYRKGISKAAVRASTTTMPGCSGESKKGRGAFIHGFKAVDLKSFDDDYHDDGDENDEREMMEIVQATTIPEELDKHGRLKKKSKNQLRAEKAAHAQAVAHANRRLLAEKARLSRCEEYQKEWLIQLLETNHQLRVCEFNDTGENMLLSRCVVILMSRFAVNYSGNSLGGLAVDSAADPFLFALRLALELRAAGLLENGIIPVLCGDANHPWEPNVDAKKDETDEDEEETYEENEAEIDKKEVAKFVRQAEHEKMYADNGMADSANLICKIPPTVIYGSYYENFCGIGLGRYGGCHPIALPNTAVDTVESQVMSVLARAHLGAVSLPGYSVVDTVNAVISWPSPEALGPAASAWHDVTDAIVNYLWKGQAASVLGVAAIRPGQHTAGFSKYAATDRLTETLLATNEGTRNTDCAVPTDDTQRVTTRNDGDDKVAANEHMVSAAFTDTNAMMMATIARLKSLLDAKHLEAINLATEVKHINAQLRLRTDEVNDLRSKLNMKPFDI